ncbi:MarR family winged helix-turn-helix transcriptional regulator [Sphingomicrobium flavum]|uniref:MarR family winged helix-turn-helix transcriptional regulator n=1 Tax=Sphingomicrobium flavum TaxID=1229164 RepID=UPI0021ADD051|nr:MarR family winged helix-turn-helix transcriptional regulator [Sphingomicrobium flavum]
MAKKITRIGRLLSQGYGFWREETYRRLGEYGFDDIRESHSPIFRYCESEPRRTADLARLAGMTKQSMGYLVSAMEKAGYVELIPDPGDQRAQLVRFTARGHKANAALAEISRSLETQLAGKIGAEELETLRALLGQITPEE